MWRASFVGLVFTGCIFGSRDEGPTEDTERSGGPSDGLLSLIEDEPVQDDGPAFDGSGGLSAHNAVRAAAEPPPMPPLAPLEWDPQLAEIATTWAEGCRFVHSQGTGLGENLYVASWAASLEEAVESWADEDQFYDYATNSCSGVCGHYTQIVWRDTERVGCGFADCPAVEGVNFGGRLWVCNYDPPGNWVGQRPY